VSVENRVSAQDTGCYARATAAVASRRDAGDDIRGRGSATVSLRVEGQVYCNARKASPSTMTTDRGLQQVVRSMQY
jgi:hypothetical protein